MLAELFLIMDLLKGNTQTPPFVDPSTKPPPTTGKTFGEALLDLPPQVLDKMPIYEVSITGIEAGPDDLRKKRREIFQ